MMLAGRFLKLFDSETSDMVGMCRDAWLMLNSSRRSLGLSRVDNHRGETNGVGGDGDTGGSCCAGRQGPGDALPQPHLSGPRGLPEHAQATACRALSPL